MLLGGEQPAILRVVPRYRSRMSFLILYQRDYCHLCDQALAVLAEARTPEFQSVWVDDSVALVARYGTRVPVLRDDGDGRELDWPFDADAARRFIGGDC